MKTARSLLTRRALHGALVLLAILLFPASALAFGNVQVKSTSLEEVDGRWKLEMDINYGSTPPMGHIPFDLVFTLNTYYEYSITDTDKEPVIRPKPMVNQQPQREGVDIAFADARNKIWPRTKFQIGIKRDRGFEAGEYTLQIKRADDGAILGQPIRLKLMGKNKLVDRRAIVFTAPPPKTKDAGAPSSEADAAASEPREEPAEAKSEEPSPADDTAAAPPAVEPRPGSHGCGCRTAASSNAGAAALLLAGLGAAVLARRRVRSRAR
jgi:MYXO-CTERM domain-containing protein